MKKVYEIPPSGKGAPPAFAEWTVGVSPNARSVPMYGASSMRAFGLPYDPASTLPTKGGATIPRTGKMYEILPAGMTGSVIGGGAKVPKQYEIVPGAGVMGRGLGSKSGGCGGKPGGCGCGGKCGGGTGHDAHASGMKRTGGCGPGKAGGCGCGGKCGGSDGGKFLPPSTGTMLLPPSTNIRLPPSWTPSGGGPAGGAGIARDIVWTGGRYNLGGSPFFSSDLGFLIPPPGPLTCAELQKIIDRLVERIHFLETAPAPPRGACGECLPGMDCVYPCNIYGGSAAGWACVCSRLALGLDTGTNWGNWSGCPGTRDGETPEQRRAIRRDAHDICNRGQVVSQLLEQLNWWLAELRRRGCVPNPPPDLPVDCNRHPELCRNLFDCSIQWWRPGCYNLGGTAPPVPPPQPPPDPVECDTYLDRFREIRGAYELVLDILRALREARNILGSSAPGVASYDGCISTPLGTAPRVPACTLINNAVASLQASLGRITLGGGRRVEVQLILSSAGSSARGALNGLQFRSGECEAALSASASRMMAPARILICSYWFSESVWGGARDALDSRIAEVLDRVSELVMMGNAELEAQEGWLSRKHCTVPPPLSEPSP